jgi:kynurenine formamidase
MRALLLKSAGQTTFVFALTLGLSLGQAWAQDGEKIPKSTVDEMMKELSNWGRWGDDDELGTLNFITPSTRKAAAALVRDGVSVSLAHNLIKDEAPDNSSPFVHDVNSSAIWAGDTYTVAYHGYAHTHMDSLCHISQDGKLYNGFPKSGVTDKGAEHLSIINIKEGVFTRGILMDIPRLKGVPYLAADTVIFPADLEAWEKKAGIKVGRGDVVFIHTGRWVKRAEEGPWDVGNASPGLHISSARWLREREVAALGSDGASDILPSPVEGFSHPVHLLALNAMGMPIFDNCDFTKLSEEAQARKRWDFLLTVAPLAVQGGTGSPLNPIATF